MSTQIKKITILPGTNKLGQTENFPKIDIHSGQVIAIVGPTGAGKSQLLYDIERLAQADTKSNRTILVNDKKADFSTRFDPKRKMIASLAQSMNFLTDMLVGDFLSLHLRSRGKPDNPNLIKEVIDEANQITGESITADMNLLNLSGGQSRALMVSDVANISSSPIVLIDEIENAGIKKEQAIKILVDEGKIVLMVTHDPSLALNAHQRIIVKNGGIDKLITTSLREKGIAFYLNWIENYSLEIRHKIRQGQKIDTIQIHCQLSKHKK
ncbi:ABC transporter ATP-binding protein [Candidatus Shapirobacteria bacterium]|nr:MAG: ABC transporter ATP-binding protein [Candidatus Shapirobacteria bacterium]